MLAATMERLPPPTVDGIPVGARRLSFLAALLLLPMAVAGALFGGSATLLAVAVGGALALANFWLLSRLVVVSTGGVQRSASALLVRLMAKFGFLGLVLGTAVLGLGLDPFGLLLGLSVVFLAVPLNLLAETVASAL